MSTVQYITVSEDNDNQRLDNFLRTQLKGVPKSMLYRIIRKGEVRVNKKRYDPSDKIYTDDIVRIPPIRMSADKPEERVLSDDQVQIIKEMIIFENEQFMVMNKPAGLAVHAGSGITQGLIEWLRRFDVKYKKAELVHRLDRGTSGCLLIAKKMSALRMFHQLFRDGAVTKIYTALVKGYWPAKLHYIDAPLQKNILQSGERMVKVDPQGQAAATTFRVLKRLPETTLVSAELHTGRTHQIRVHALHTGFPIVGDEKYGDKPFNKIMATQNIKRLCLHATQLSFVWPETQQKFTFDLPITESFFLSDIATKN